MYDRLLCRLIRETDGGINLAKALIESLDNGTAALDKTTADGFATVKQNGTGWTWEPHTVGLGSMLSRPTVPYISQRAAYDGLQRAIAALLRDGLREKMRHG